MQQQEDIPPDLADLIRLGTIETVDHEARRCIVRYGDVNEDDTALTPPIRWVASRSGKTRTYSPPSEGEQVVLLCPYADLAQAVALCGLERDDNPLPADGVKEITEFEDGARIAYDPEAHALTAVLPDGGTATISASGGITIKADVIIEGNVTLTGQLDAGEDVTTNGISLKSHPHSGVQTGNGNSGGPVAS